jgi:hypothetical protein
VFSINTDLKVETELVPFDVEETSGRIDKVWKTFWKPLHVKPRHLLGYWVEILHDVEEHVEGQGMERERGRGGRLVDILRSREGN